MCLQEIDAILAGGLTEQDEDDVLAELDSLVEVMIFVYGTDVYEFINE